jgi:hypothetical protein
LVTASGFAIGTPTAAIGGWTGIAAGVITNAVGPHGFNFFFSGGIMTNATVF